MYLWCKVNHKRSGVITNDERKKKKERKEREEKEEEVVVWAEGAVR